MTNLTSIVNQIEPVHYKSTLVVTSKTLAEVYGTTRERIRKNFAANKDKFESGKHYFKIGGQDLDDLRVSLKDSQNIHYRIRSLLLWTERGAARHAKMLETDKAWEVFEALEDNYFRRNVETVSSHLPAPAIPNDALSVIQEALTSYAKEKQRLNQPWLEYAEYYACLEDIFYSCERILQLRPKIERVAQQIKTTCQ